MRRRSPTGPPPAPGPRPPESAPAAGTGRAKENRPRRAAGRAFTRETGDQGLEPRLTEPESVVLPLHQSPRCKARLYIGPSADQEQSDRAVAAMPSRRCCDLSRRAGPLPGGRAVSSEPGRPRPRVPAERHAAFDRAGGAGEDRTHPGSGTSRLARVTSPPASRGVSGGHFRGPGAPDHLIAMMPPCRGCLPERRWRGRSRARSVSDLSMNAPARAMRPAGSSCRRIRRP